MMMMDAGLSVHRPQLRLAPNSTNKLGYPCWCTVRVRGVDWLPNRCTFFTVRSAPSQCVGLIAAFPHCQPASHGLV